MNTLGSAERERPPQKPISRERTPITYAGRFIGFLAGLWSLSFDHVEASFIVRPNQVATTGLVSEYDGFHVVFYGTGYLPTIVNLGGIVADFQGGVTPTTLAVSRFSGSFSDFASGRRFVTSAGGNASAGAMVAVSGLNESYFVQNSFTVSGFISPGDSMVLNGSYSVTNGANITYYQNTFNFQLPVQGAFSFTMTDPSHVFVNDLANNISQLQENAGFGATFTNNSTVSPSYVNFDGFVLVTTVPEPSSILLLSVAVATRVGYHGARRHRSACPSAG